MNEVVTIPKEDYVNLTKAIERLGKILPTREVLCRILVPRKTANDRLAGACGVITKLPFGNPVPTLMRQMNE